MTQVPHLKTERLTLSAFSPEDAGSVFKYANHPKVAETVTWDAHKTMKDSLGFIRFVTSKISLEPGKIFLAWAIRENGRAIGSISFSQVSDIAGQIDYALSHDHWNKGLMTEAAAHVMNWAFAEFRKIVRIQAKCLPANAGSRRVMEKTGMQFEGVNRSCLWVKGKAIDLAVYASIRTV